MFELNSLNAAEYLQKHQRIDQRDLKVRELGGGVSNTVLLIEGRDVRLVLKQSLGKLRVEQDWFSDRQRILKEVAALKLISGALPQGFVPEVLFEDAANCLFGMTAAPPDALSWKDILLRGEGDPGTASLIGSMLAETIRFSWQSKELASDFGDQTVFDQLRLDPYYRSTAARHPDLQSFYEKLISSCRKRRASLVHGDWSPKNFLVNGSRVMAIDYEVIHFGDPSFDAAFMLNHLMLKSFHLPERADHFALLADQFWTSLEGGLPVEAEWFESATLAHLAGLLLARIDGKSPAEYIKDTERKQEIRRFARGLMADPPPDIGGAFERRLR